MEIPLSHRRPTPLARFLYGAAYYPEHWAEDIRSGDPDWMADAGFNCVRMAEFAWDVLEPKEGCYDFSLFDRTIERMAAKGIFTILCTPTASPPRWLTRDYPEVFRRNADGVDLVHGSRQHASHISPLFRDYSRRITSAMASHFQSNSHVIGWQTDNEFHCHFSEDHSDAAQVGFRDYLRRKFDGNIGRLNAAWGTAFWTLTYGSFDEIETPRQGKPIWNNPAHLLDYARFLSDATAAFQRDQVTILRAANSRWFVTHNGCYSNIDYRSSFTRDLDFLSYDCYPFMENFPSKRYPAQAFKLDWVRSYSGNFMIMEQQSGPGGQAAYFNENPEPGEMRRMAYTTMARGADSVLLFRERSCRFGAEEYWCGVLDHDNVPRRRFREAARLGKELKTVGPALLGTRVHCDVGIAMGDFAAIAGQKQLNLGLPSPLEMAEVGHGIFLSEGYAVGGVHPSDDLSGLRTYVVPHWIYVDPAWVGNLEAFVKAGGTLIVGARSASKDADNNIVPETLPGVLRSVLGVTVEEYGRQNGSGERPLPMRIGSSTHVSELWFEHLLPDPKTETVGYWIQRHLKGEAAVTLRKLGKGCAIYVGTYLTAGLWKALLPLLRKRKLLPALLPGHRKEIEIVRRTDGTKNLWFYINHGTATAALADVPKGVDLIGGKATGKILRLKPNEVAIIRADA